MKSMLLAAALLAATAAQAAPVLSTSPTGDHGTTHGTLSLGAASDVVLQLHATSALAADLSFSTFTLTQGSTVLSYLVPESWTGSGTSWVMDYLTPTMTLGAGTWDVAVTYDDAQPGNAAAKRSAFDVNLLSSVPHINSPVAAVPEPHGVALMGAGLLALGYATRRKQATARL